MDETTTEREGAVVEVLEDLVFSYPGASDVRYVVPKGTVVRRGEAACILGVSGSGKSTAMTMLAMLRPFLAGRVRYRLGEAHHAVIDAERWGARVGPSMWGRIGFAFQRPELIRSLTVKGNLALVGLGDSTPPLFDDEEWQGVARSRTWKLSGGQVQRLGLLRAFARDPRLVFLDEPTNNLDRRNRDEVAAFVSSHRPGRALVVVSHDDEFVRSLRFDRMFAIDEAREGALRVRTLVPTLRCARAEHADREAEAALLEPARCQETA